MAELIREDNWRQYKSVIRRIKMKWITIYGDKAEDWFGV